MANQPSSAELMDHFLGLLRNFDTATLVTHTLDHELHGRPMGIADVDDDGTIWFLTDGDSAKVSEIAEDSRVMVTLQSTTQYVVAKGRAQVVRDAKRIEELWKAADRVWFTGKDDPALVLLSFFCEEAEFWDTAGTRGVKFAYKAAKALISGEPIKEDLGDPKVHAKLAI